MNRRAVILVLSYLLFFEAAILLLSGQVAYFMSSNDVQGFLYSAGATAIGAIFLWFIGRGVPVSLSPKDGYAIVTFGWLLVSAFGALPFCWGPEPSMQLSFVDAYFETMSGLTTTGASVITDIESLPKGILLWRSLTHWLGGMGIVLLFLAILPALGAGGFQLFRAELPGTTKDKISPKITNTAKLLWGIYLGISLALFLSLWGLTEMNVFDAICHTFGTVATGGFSTKNASVAYFDSWQIDAIITLFMFICGCNFMLFIKIIKGEWQAPWRSQEFRLYFWVVVISIGIVSVLTVTHGQYDSIIQAVRFASFQVVSLITSTGFVTADFDLWPLFCQVLFLALMFMGACAGSTGGGMKVFRVLTFFKVGVSSIKKLVNPRAIVPVSMDGRQLGDQLMRSILGFVCLFIICLGAFTLGVAILEEDGPADLLSIFSICLSCISNIGPGVDHFGPTDNYAGLQDSSKYLLSFLMLLGRLEVYSVLIIFHPQCWKR